MTEAKQPYRLSEPEIEVERFERPAGVRYRIHSHQDGESIEVTPQGLRDLEAWLQIHMIRIEAEAASTQPGDVQEQLRELDLLELAEDRAEELMIQTNDEGEAFRQWKALKANQSAQQDIKTALESQGYRITLDLEPHAPARHSASRRVGPTEHKHSESDPGALKHPPKLW